MEQGWTAELAEDLSALAQLAALQPITLGAYDAAGYPSDEEEFQAHVDRTEGETEGVDHEHMLLFGWPWHGEQARPSVGGPGGLLALWPPLQAALGVFLTGFLRTWPKNAPLLPS
jgi:hypothetical protein